MTEALRVAPEGTKVNTGAENREAIAKGLADILSDTYRLMFKTHAYHWNVEGPMFYSLHNLTEDQYNDLFKAADEIAERVRALGFLAPWSLDWMGEQSVISSPKKAPSAGEMIEELTSDHERLAHRLHALVELAGEDDPVTEDMAIARSAFHEKATWMLRSLGKS
ncbi:MAG: Dps family protein [Mangrovicoccus sp.]